MSNKHYAVVIDTTQYTGNFHREMAAYITGNVVDCYRGHAFARQASGQVKSKGWINQHSVEKMIRYGDISRYTYSDMFERPFSELPTTHLYTQLMNYYALIFFFDQEPPLQVVEELVERAQLFAANLKGIYENAQEAHCLALTSSDFNGGYSQLKGNGKTLDIVDVRFFEVDTAHNLFDVKKDAFIQVEHEYVFNRTEEQFMKEHKLKKANTSAEIAVYTSNLKKINKQERLLVSAYLNREGDGYKRRLNEVFFLLYKIDYFMNDGLTIDELNDYYKEFGSKLFDLKGKCFLTKNVYAIPYDGVQYAVKQEPTNYRIEKNVNDVKTIIDNYHQKVKEVYTHLERQGVKDIWVYVHVNGSITATYGNNTGILAIFELGQEKSIYDFMKPVKKKSVPNLVVVKKIQTKYFANHTIKDINLKYKEWFM